MNKIIILMILLIGLSYGKMFRPIYHYSHPVRHNTVHHTSYHTHTHTRPHYNHAVTTKPVMYHNYNRTYYAYEYSWFWPTILILHSQNHASQNTTYVVNEQTKDFKLTICKIYDNSNCDEYLNPEYELYNDEIVVKTKHGNRIYNSNEYNISLKN